MDSRILAAAQEVLSGEGLQETMDGYLFTREQQKQLVEVLRAEGYFDAMYGR